MKKDDLFRFTCGTRACDRRLQGYCHNCGVRTIEKDDLFRFACGAGDCGATEVARVKHRLRVKTKDKQVLATDSKSSGQASRLLQRNASELSAVSTLAYDTD
jgi:hypothetical protein